MMGFWKEFFSDLDKPAFGIEVRTRRITIDDDDKQVLLEENKQLRKLLKSKKTEAIDTDFKLLE